jgi:hypothetical protein
MRILLPLLPITALLSLAGCNTNPPSPQASLSCEQYRQVGDFEYLNCLRGFQAQSGQTQSSQTLGGQIQGGQIQGGQPRTTASQAH